MLISEREEFWIILEVMNDLCSSSSPVVWSCEGPVVPGNSCTVGGSGQLAALTRSPLNLLVLKTLSGTWPSPAHFSSGSLQS